MKKILLFVLCVLSVFLLAGCHSGSSGNVENAGRPQQEQAFRGDPKKQAEMAEQMRAKAQPNK